MVKTACLIIGWYIAIFHGFLSQVMDAKPPVRAVIGLLLSVLMSISLPNRLLKEGTNYQKLVYWIETIEDFE